MIFITFWIKNSARYYNMTTAEEVFVDFTQAKDGEVNWWVCIRQHKKRIPLWCCNEYADAAKYIRDAIITQTIDSGSSSIIDVENIAQVWLQVHGKTGY